MHIVQFESLRNIYLHIVQSEAYDPEMSGLASVDRVQLSSALSISASAVRLIGREKRMTNLLRIVGILGLAWLAYAQPMQPNAATLAMQLGSGFESKFAQVNGT